MSVIPGASVSIVENPNRDPITKAQAKVDFTRRQLALNAEEQERLAAKVAKAEAHLGEAQAAEKTSQATRKALDAELAEYADELAAARDADPELAAELDVGRERATAQRRIELEAELARLNEGN